MIDLLTDNEIGMARFCIERALELGASAIRVSLNKNVTDSATVFNGQLDKVTHSSDRSIFLYLFVDGKYGTFSTNCLDRADLDAFLIKAIDTTRLLESDPCRSLPQKERTVQDAVTGLEAGLFDKAYFEEDVDSRIAKALRLSKYEKLMASPSEDWSLISEECEWSDSVDDTILLDSQGLEARHTETSAGCFCEMNVSDKEGNKYSGYWWDSSWSADKVNLEECAEKALKKVLKQFSPKRSRGGKYKMVVDTSVASRLLTPVINALNASSVQQKMSFLEDSLGKKLFPANLTIMDMGREAGKLGARLYDSEGVAVRNAPIIENGVVKQYFTNTYLAAKTGFEPTVEDVSRPCVKAFVQTGESSGNIELQDILKLCGSGVYVTGFNGGNSNPVTGDFSFGVEGFRFKNGKITHPVKEMLITGNLIELWNNLIAAGSDARACTRWQIPSLAFSDVCFSA